MVGLLSEAIDSTLMIPAVLYPVTKDMDVYHQEQFGPVVPIVPYDDISPILEYGRVGDDGQQVSIFTSGQSAETVAVMLDNFSAVFGKININSQCGRSPTLSRSRVDEARRWESCQHGTQSESSRFQRL
jgi:glyceraldehyde-3-phosphate dehydrogenase (NADP+)